ncbi:MAG: type II secretion system F family protein [archaeon YNP-WB-062]|nr:type II secretion system F family protein [Candidatus Culexarchaeum yellowstonense]MCS7367209.1 type II secretion system F family protein [Candidatus Culexarchaeum yellowstonense]
MLWKGKALQLTPISLSYRIFGKLANIISHKLNLNEIMVHSGLKISPQGYCSIFLFYLLLIVLPASTIASIFLSILFSSFSFLILSPLCVFSAFLVFYLYPRVRMSLRASGVESELPFISTYFSMLSLSHVPIFRGFESLSSQDVFPWFKFESEIFLTDYRFFSKDPMQSMKFLAYNHPCKDFRDYLDSYIRSVESGGYPSSSLMDYTLKLGERLSSKLKNFSSDVSIFGDLIVTLFLFLPLGLIGIFMIMNPFNALLFLKLYTFIFTPLMAFSIFIIIDSSQLKYPFRFGNYKRILFYSFPPFVLTLFILLNLRVDFPILFTVSSTVLLAPLSIFHEYNAIKCRSIDSSLSKFIRDISDYVKVGLSVEGALALASGRSYGKLLDDIIRNIHSSLTSSMKSIADIFNDLISRVNSWFAKRVFWLFGEAISTGGGRPEIFSHLSKFCWDYYEFKRRIENELKLYVLVGYFSSLMLIFVSSQLIKFLGFFGAGYSIPSQSILLSIDKSVVMELNSIINSMIILTSFSIGMLVGKISSGTILGGFKHALISCYICVLGIYGGVRLW